MMNHRAERLASEEELARRVDVRRALDGERRRVRCKHCHGPMPPERRRDALYCSPFCSRNYHPAALERLKREVRETRRALAYPRDCPDCGLPMPPLPRYGRVPGRCKRCRNNANSRRYWRQKHGKPETPE